MTYDLKFATNHRCRMVGDRTELIAWVSRTRPIFNSSSRHLFLVTLSVPLSLWVCVCVWVNVRVPVSIC